MIIPQTHRIIDFFLTIFYLPYKNLQILNIQRFHLVFSALLIISFKFLSVNEAQT